MEQNITVELDSAKLIWQGDWTWLAFESKPETSLISTLKESGGKWSMKRQSWYFTRHLSALDVDNLFRFEAIVAEAPKRSILTENIQPKPYRRGGEVVQPKNSDGTYNAEIVKGQSIRIFGLYTNHVGGPQQFDKTFKIGDSAEYGSYNLTYVGKVIKIGEKTVTIKHYEHTNTVTQLCLHDFIWRNWNFDAERIAKENYETSMYI